jgi:hypothetical protein
MQTLKKVYRRWYLWLIMLQMICSSSIQLNAQSPVNVTKTNPKPVYVHIMPWFDGPMTLGEGNWGYHWKMHKMNPNTIVDNATGKRQIASHYYPEIGPYDSSDPDVIDYQLLLMKYCGADGILIDWYGTAGTVGDIETNLRNSDSIVKRSLSSGLNFAIVIEDRFTGGDVSVQRDALVYMKDHYFTQSNYYRYGVAQDPLVGIFGPTTITGQTNWNTILAGIEDIEFLPLLYKGPDVGAGNMDGEFAWPYQSPNTTDHGAHLENFYEHRAPTLKTAMGVIYPGFHDFYAEGEYGGSSYFYIPHNGTNTFTYTMNLTADYKNAIDIVQVATWNDYGEGTMIEPTREFGYSFLTQLQQYTGVSYTAYELKQITRLFNLRKQYAHNLHVKAQLNQVYKYLAALQVDEAVALMCAIDNICVPVITSELTGTAVLGDHFTYTITATGNPISFDALGLPNGLSINKSTGEISGIAEISGNHVISIQALNDEGIGTATFTLSVETPTNTYGELDKSFVIAPNPVSNGILTCQLPNMEGSIHVKIIDVQGVELHSYDSMVLNNELKLDLSLLKAGLYIINLGKASQSFVMKVIIDK